MTTPDTKVDLNADDTRTSLFAGNLNSLRDVFLAIALWNSMSLGAIYLVTGVIAARVFRWKARLAFLLPLGTTILGLLSGFAQGALFAVGVALVYNTGGFVMEWHVAAIWGCGLSGVHLLVALLQNWYQW